MGLNVSKGNMYEFITHTFNTIKGKCYHDCSYCHPEGTMILMSDFTENSIENIKIGDEIIGIKKDYSDYYKFIKSKVINTSERFAETIKITTDDGEINSTKEHPYLGGSVNRGGNDWRRAESLKIGNVLRYIGRSGKESESYKKGYLSGFCDGDGCYFKFKNTGTNNIYNGFEAVCVDENLRAKFISICNSFGINIKIGFKKSSNKSFNKGNSNPLLYSKTQKDVLLLKDICRFELMNNSKDYLIGYLGGMIDTDGSIGEKFCIRIHQSESANIIKLERIILCCRKLGIKYVKEKNGIRINGSFKIRATILFEAKLGHLQKKNRLMLNSTIKGTKKSIIKSIFKNALISKVYNLQTECESFIANGFIVHNCYMKRFGT